MTTMTHARAHTKGGRDSERETRTRMVHCSQRLMTHQDTFTRVKLQADEEGEREKRERELPSPNLAGAILFVPTTQVEVNGPSLNWFTALW